MITFFFKTPEIKINWWFWYDFNY